MKEGFERKTCAIRILSENRGVIPQSVFDKADRAPIPHRFAQSSEKTAPLTPSSPVSRPGLSKRKPRRGSLSQRPPADAPPSQRARARAVVSLSSSSSSSSSSSNDDDFETEASSDEDSPRPAPSAKRPRTGKQDKASGKVGEKGIVFKLISDSNQAARYFTLKDCKTGKDMFRKSREFFRIFDKDAAGRVLECQIPPQREKRYLFDGNEDEFDLFATSLKHAHSLNAGGALLVQLRSVVTAR